MKRNKLFSKHIPCAIAVISMAAIVAGCGSKTVGEGENLELSDLVLATVSDNTLSLVSDDSEFKQRFGMEYSEIAEEFSDIPIEVYDTIPHVNDITQDELFEMDLQQIRAFISVFEPNYREVYIITEDKVMEDEDWEMVRLLLSYQLYGSIRNSSDYSYEVDFDTFAESVKEDFQESTNALTDEDIADLELELEYINSLSIDEFAAYMNEIFATAGYTNEDGSAIDVTEEEDVDLNEVKEALIQSIELQILESQSTEEDVTDTTATVLEGELESPLADIENDAE